MPSTRTGWLAATALFALAVGVWLHLRWPSARPALDCDPREVRWSGAGVARCDPGAAAARIPPGPGLTVGVKLDLNRASAEELALVPGVGPALARKLVEARASRGGFKTWDEVDAVGGIGPAKLDALREAVELR